MSKQGFDALFEGYPENIATVRLRRTFGKAINSALRKMAQAKKLLNQASIKNPTALKEAFTIIDKIDFWFIQDTTPVINTAYRNLYAPLHTAVNIYNDALKARKQATGKSTVTTAEFQACKKALKEAAKNITAWFESVKP